MLSCQNPKTLYGILRSNASCNFDFAMRETLRMYSKPNNSNKQLCQFRTIPIFLYSHVIFFVCFSSSTFFRLYLLQFYFAFKSLSFFYYYY